MADNIVRLKLDSGTFDANIKSAAAGLVRMEKECRKVAGTFEVVEKAQLDYVRSLGQMDTKSDSTTRKIRELREAIANASSVYKNLSDEEKKSDFGVALSQSIDQLKGRLAPLKDLLADLDQEYKNMASDTSFADSMNLMTGTIGNCASAIVAWTGDSKEMEAMIQQLAKVQTAVTAIKSVTTALQEQNLVMLKNPYAIAVAGVAALVGALALLDDALNGLTQDEKNVLELQTKAIDNYAKEKAKIETLHTIASDYNRSIEDRNSALAELKEIVPDYHGALSNEGRLINDNTGALSKYIDKLEQAATAQAAFENIVELTKKKMKMELDIKSGNTGGFFNSLYSEEVMREQIKGIDKEIAFYQGYTNSSGAGGKNYDSSAGLGSLAGIGAQFITDFAANARKGGGGGGGGRGSRGSGSYGSSFNLPNIAPIPMGTTESMNELNALAKMYTSQRDSANDQFVKQSAQDMLNSVNGAMGAQDTAMMAGMSAFDVSAAGEKVKSLMDAMREEMAKNPLVIQVDDAQFQKSMDKIARADKLDKVAKNAQGLSTAFSGASSALKSLAGDSKAAAAAMAVMDFASTVSALVSSFAKAMSKGTVSIWDWIAGGLAGTAALATMISNIKSVRAEYHSEGGIVGQGTFVPKGTDTVPAMLTPGETVLSAAQTSNIASLFNNDEESQGGQLVVRADQLVYLFNNYGMKHGLGKLKFG